MKDTAMLVTALAELDYGHFIIIAGFLSFMFRDKLRALLFPFKPKSNGNGTAAKASADKAHTRLDMHEKECERRHENIREQFKTMRQEMTDGFNRVHKRLDDFISK